MKQILLYILTIICILLTSQAKAQDKFHTNEGIPYIPLLDSAPTADSAGSAYLNSTDNIVYWYDGNSWIPGCGLYAPDGTKVVEIVSSSGRTWMDRNLGASQVAISSTDADAYGDLYQWGRAADGHESRTSDTTSTLATSDTPGHGNFITNISSPYDWLSTQNDNLWQGESGINTPCPSGYRLPTEAEWEAEIATWSSNNSAGAFASPLKLPMAGSRYRSNGSLCGVDSYGDYWSSTVSGTNASHLSFNSSAASMYSYYRAYGHSVRCIKDE